MGAPSGLETLLFIRHLDGDWFVGWGGVTRQAAPPLDRPAFYLPDFFLTDPEPWWVPKEFHRMSTPELLMTWPALKKEAPKLGWKWTEPDENYFYHEIQALLDKIHKGDLKKAVPIALACSSRVPTDEEKFALWQKTLNIPPRWIAYGGWWNGEGLIGLSPEFLFFAEPGWIESMALAGTAPHPGPSMLEDEKTMLEHKVVVDDLVDQLTQFGKVRTVPTREWVIGSIKHLRTDLAVAGNAAFMDLVMSMHPTPALGGFPRSQGHEWLTHSHFAKERRRFGAPFGVHVPGQLSLCAVAIRNIQWDHGQTWQASGCGVVEGSVPQKEWQELALKRRVVREQFGLI